MLSLELERLRFNDVGLIPAVVRDVGTGAILMMAWMNEESIRRTTVSGETWFWSRSRNALWRKGATSGNTQRVVAIATDCDADTLLIDVVPRGAACHTGMVSCFGQDEGDRLDLHSLIGVLRSRRQSRPAGSYSAQLFESGLDRILKKVGEESAEVIIAAKGDSRERLVEELADLLYHLSVLLVEKDIGLNEIAEVLELRASKTGGNGGKRPAP